MRSTSPSKHTAPFQFSFPCTVDVRRNGHARRSHRAPTQTLFTHPWTDALTGPELAPTRLADHEKASRGPPRPKRRHEGTKASPHQTSEKRRPKGGLDNLKNPAKLAPVGQAQIHLMPE